MRRVQLEELERRQLEVDECVARAPDIDLFCSSSLWALAAHRSLMPPRSTWAWADETGWLLLALGEHASGLRVLQPLEWAWSFACPLIAPEPKPIAAALARRLSATRGEWDVLALAGLPVGSALLEEVVQALSGSFALRRGPITRRCTADLSGGLDGFLSRRSRGLRRSLRKAERRAAASGVSIVAAARRADAGGAAALHERTLAVERRSWKGLSGQGVDHGPMRDFYGDVVRRLAQRGSLRLLFAQLDGRDVGYVLGGTFAGTYRGLQFSFDETRSDLSVGNLLQLAQVRDLCEEGILAYDLGSDVPYKRRWSDGGLETVMLLVS